MAWKAGPQESVYVRSPHGPHLYVNEQARDTRPSAITSLDKVPRPSVCLDTVPRPSTMPSKGDLDQCHDMPMQGASA